MNVREQKTQISFLSVVMIN